MMALHTQGMCFLNEQTVRSPKCIWVCTRVTLYSIPRAVKNSAFSITYFWGCQSTATSLSTVHLNSVEWYLKEAIPSDSLAALCVAAATLRRALFEARKRGRENPLQTFWFTARK